MSRLHKEITSNSWLQLFSAIIRGLLALGFIVPGLKKVVNVPFAPGIPVDQPIGYFFDAFFQATEYYIFVGIAQLVAGLLLLFPSTVAIGSFIYLPIILNIFVITITLQFTGTWLIAGLMLLATIYLVCWEFDKWCLMIPGFNEKTAILPEKNLSFFRTVTAGALASVTGLSGLFLIRGLFIQGPVMMPLLITVSGLTLGLYLGYRFWKKSNREATLQFD
ncbi:MAG: hypothetical protein R3222_07990 [Balneolaceae bacterium]|nr:hypothetical protein [Balneolaceae bacterium]